MLSRIVDFALGSPAASPADGATASIADGAATGMLARLPAELVLDILGLLAGAADVSVQDKVRGIVSVGATCRRLRAIVAREQSLWEAALVGAFPFFDFSRAVPLGTAAGLELPHKHAPAMGVMDKAETPVLAQGHETLLVRSVHVAAASRQSDKAPDDVDWPRMARLLFEGRLCVQAQVFDKHVQQGLMLSCYDAVIVLVGPDQWLAYYLFATPREKFQPEIVPPDRIRRVPEDIRGMDPTERIFPEHSNHLKVGDIIEIAYRFRASDPYGLWIGTIHSVEVNRADDTKVYICCFPQYNEGSPWRYEKVVTQRIVPGLEKSGEITAGGIRLASEIDQWRQRKQSWGLSFDEWM